MPSFLSVSVSPTLLVLRKLLAAYSVCDTVCVVCVCVCMCVVCVCDTHTRVTAAGLVL